VRSQVNILQLVYPPISNQEAEWLKDDPQVQEELRASNMYMICQRQEAFLQFPPDGVHRSLQQGGQLDFEFQVGSASSRGGIDIGRLLSMHNVSMDTSDVEIELGEKFLRFWKADSVTGERTGIIDWFTTEKLLFDKWHGHPAVVGLEEYRQFTQYLLHYVGISKKEDSLQRLVIKPHDTRLRILSNEHAKTRGSRVTDELILLFFAVNPLRMSVLETDEEIAETVRGVEFDKVAIVADAEKAYVSILKSEYNKIRFADYPKGQDGLYDSGLARYGFVIGEEISLLTSTDTIVGGLISDSKWSQSADFIFVDGEQVTLEKPVDHAST